MNLCNNWIKVTYKLQVKIIIFSPNAKDFLEDNSWKIYIETGILMCI